MKRRFILLACGLLVVLGIGYAYASPYWTVSRIRQAAVNGDAETVNAHVDFPALRESVKGWMGAVMIKQMRQSEMKDNPFSAFGIALGMMMADKLVEAMVTPEGVRAMLEGNRPQPQPTLTGQRRGSRSSEPPDKDVTMRYESYDRFAVTFRDPARPADEFTLVWQRSGLTWKLTSVRLPTPE